jgi:hypothetical protein
MVQRGSIGKDGFRFPVCGKSVGGKVIRERAKGPARIEKMTREPGKRRKGKRIGKEFDRLAGII